MSKPVERTLEAPLRRFRPYPEYKYSGVEWLEKIPAHWDVRQIRRLLRSIEQGWSPTADDRPANDDEWAVIKLSAIHAGSFNDNEHKTLPDGLEPLPALEIRKGDVLLTRANTPDRVGDACLVTQTRQRLMLSDLVYRLGVEDALIDRQFLVYVLLSLTGRHQIKVDAHGSNMTMAKISQGHIKSWVAFVPPRPEQLAVTRFLSRETAKIDALIAKKEQLIELLQEKRTALITHSVTKGLDPGVPMKDSGVEWLGEIPAHWECVQLSLITVARCDGPFGSALKSEHYTSSGVRVVRLQNIGWAQFRDEDRAYIEPAYASELGDHWIKAGDLLIGGLGDDRHPVGRTCVAPEGLGPAIVKADTFRFRVDNRRISPYFAAYQLSAGAEATSGSASTGSTRSRMNLSSTSSRKLAIPPLAEQKVIIDHIVATSEKLDELAGKVLEGIDRLRELRTALISAAVTGKIDIRGEAS